jgi:hypothetical protein
MRPRKRQCGALNVSARTTEFDGDIITAGSNPRFFCAKNGVIQEVIQRKAKKHPETLTFQGKKAKKWHLQWDSNPLIRRKSKKGHTRGHILLLFPAFGKAGN